MKISEQIFPRVVGLITSVDEKGKPNIMTASFLMPISFEPKYVAFSVSPKRYTFENLKKVKEFVLNICNKDMLKSAEICGSYSGRNKDKFKLADLEVEKSKIVKPPMIKNCPVSLECKIKQIKEFGDHFLVVGKVVNEKIRREDFEPLIHKTGGIVGS